MGKTGYKSIKRLLLTALTLCILCLSCNPTTRNDPALEKPLDQLTDEDISRMVAVVKTNYGNFKIEFHPEWAPLNCRNFIKLVKHGHYDGLTIHEIRPGFWIRGGDQKADGSGEPGQTVALESSPNLRTHRKGAVGIYHPPQLPDSGGDQFYILLRDYHKWDGLYTIFGKVADSMTTVERIAALPITPGDGKPRPYMPLSPVIIKDIHLEVKK